MRELTRLTMADDWSAGVAGRMLNERLNGDLRVLRLARARVQGVLELRPTPQAARALSTLHAAMRVAEVHGADRDEPDLGQPAAGAT